MLSIYIIVCLLTYRLFSAESEENYWQQYVHYTFNIRLDTEMKFLIGDASILYRNNSPDTLHELWLHLYPNAFKDENTVLAKEAKKLRWYRHIDLKNNGYIEFSTVRLIRKNQPLENAPTPAYQISGTLMVIPLIDSLAPGEECTLYLEFKEKIRKSIGRAGYRGKQFDFAQWYPKLCVYDQKGWHSDEFHVQGEFYGEFGTFDVAIELPYNYIVAATGEVVEGDPGWKWVHVDTSLSDKEWKEKYKEQLAEIEKQKEQAEIRVVKFHAENVHDFAWLTSPEFLYERGEINGIPIHVLYRKSARRGWSKKVVERGQNVLKWLIKRFGPYPYPQLSITHGLMGGGMEYPMLVMDGSPNEGLIAHEVGHIYFYGIWASDELAEAWMDEGGTSYQERWYQETRYGKLGYEQKAKNWLEKMLPENTRREREIIRSLRFMTSPHYEPISRYSHQFTRGGYGINAYTRGALFHDMLHKMVGDSLWAEIFREYYRRWALKHVNEERFREVCEDVSGLDLGRFFHQWLHDTVNVDYALKSVQKTRQKDGTWYSQLKVERKDKGIMPVDVLVKTGDGQSIMKRWDGIAKFAQLEFRTKSEPRQFILDPDDNIFDKNRLNNRGIGIKHVLDVPLIRYTPRNDYLMKWFPISWYNDVDGQWLGVRLRGSYLDDYFRLETNVSFGFMSQEIDYGFHYSHPLQWNRRNLKYNLRFIKKEGRVIGDIGFNYNYSKRMYASAYHWITFGLHSSQLLKAGVNYAFRKIQVNGEIQNLKEWQPGRVNKLYFHYHFDPGFRYNRSSASIRLAMSNKTFGSEFNFTKLDGTFILKYVSRAKHIALRLFGGAILGEDTAPMQERFFTDGAGPLQRFEKFHLRSVGAFPAEAHYHFAGDGNLRGYLDQPMAVEKIISSNLEATYGFNLPFIGRLLRRQGLSTALNGFFDMANVWNTDDPSDLLMDAGLGFHLGARVFRKRITLRFDFPFWVGDPIPGKNELAFRWLIGFDEAF